LNLDRAFVGFDRYNWICHSFLPSAVSLDSTEGFLRLTNNWVILASVYKLGYLPGSTTVTLVILSPFRNAMTLSKPSTTLPKTA